MLRRLLMFSLVAVSCTVGASGGALAADLGLITGSDKGTYYQFGLNLQALTKPEGITVTVYPSQGSVENIYAVYQRPGVHVGIVQSDVLAFVARLQSDPVLQRIAKKIKMVFPLYDEEVHLLVRRGIANFDDLADKRVGIGREGSGTYLTARLLFKLAEVVPRETVAIDTDEALAALKAGRIDAMFLVDGSPIKLLAEGVAAENDLVLAPITNKDIAEFYPRAVIAAKVYPWQPEAIDTVAVKAVLVSFDYKKKECETVGRFAQLVSTHLEWLAKNGHPKWKSVNLDFPLKGWEQYECARKYLKPPAARSVSAPRSGDGNPVMDAIRDIFRE